MKLIYKESGTFQGIPTYRFVAPSTLFANGSVYPPNEGFCPCLESGIQNVSTCRFSTCRFPREGSGRVSSQAATSLASTPDNPIRPEIRKRREKKAV